MASKKQYVDFLSQNLLKGNKKVTKSELNQKDVKTLEALVAKFSFEERFKTFCDTKEFYALLWDEENLENVAWILYGKNLLEAKEKNIDEIEAEGLSIIDIFPKSDGHKCKYCGGIARGENKDELCSDCRELFGHKYYSEL